MKKIILFIMLCLISTIYIGCNKEKPEEEEIPVVTVADKETAIADAQAFVGSLNSSDYTAESWSHIESLMITCTTNIMNATTKEDIDFYVKVFKNTVELVQKKPIDENTSQVVTEEVWNAIKESLSKSVDSLTKNDYEYDLDYDINAFGNIGTDIINFKFNGAHEAESGKNYINLQSSDLKLKAWLNYNENSKENVVYFDIQSNELNGKYSLGISDFLLYIFESNFDFDLTKKTKLSTNKPSFDSSFIDMESLIEIIESASSSEMFVGSDQILVSIIVSSETVSEKYPELTELITDDLKIEIVLVNNIVTKINLIPQNANEEEGSVISKIQISYSDYKLMGSYVYIPVLGKQVPFGVKYNYENVVIDEIDYNEFEKLNINTFLEKREFKENGLLILNSYRTYKSLSLSTFFEAYVTNFLNEKNIMFLVNNMNLEIYVDTVNGDLYIKNSKYVGKLSGVLIPTFDFVNDFSSLTNLKKVDIDVAKIITIYGEKQVN